MTDTEKAFDFDTVQAAFAASEALAPAVEEISQLIELWPLDDAARIDNDVKYGEELQVRITREIAARLTSQDVTIADSEYVYEGGVEEIPGRPRAIATALLAANDAYDDSSDYSEDLDAAHIADIGATLGLEWNDADVEELKRVVSTATHAATTTPAADIAAHVAVSAAAYANMLAVGESEGFEAAALLFANELNEIQGLPHVFIDVDGADRFRELAKNIASGTDTHAASESFIADYATAAIAECAKHREDVLWDPAEAKKTAKEADEAKNKAALAAKFAHVDNDAGKEHIEL
ncbi:MAG: hypothetical protein LKJ47_07590 [Bifidobacteriaceae bacterium]|jgi:hypothetical protein|nr:hypothetical protein [Bifidobacteriaceae bacterium]